MKTSFIISTVTALAGAYAAKSIVDFRGKEQPATLLAFVRRAINAHHDIPESLRELFSIESLLGNVVSVSFVQTAVV